ncbi:Putative redoxin [Septoria linicola]|uniref:Redoxin n=1 Tax=Septoria linicola TaxID=215465 RepID=A0A9Q9ACB4_9PEZI|nr:putative redoxin [Septoria linicola]USW46924.1 Putative redoxin [Septoria linicola]
MPPLQKGDKFPADVKFEWAPITDPSPTSCGLPQTYDASKEFENKKVVLVSVPGAFTPGCQAYHLPPYLEKIEQLQGKGVDLVVVIASNDAWVMSAWGKVNGAKEDTKVLFMSDTKTFFSKAHGWSAGPDRNGRWVMVIEKDGTVSVADAESGPGKVTVSGADAVLSKL